MAYYPAFPLADWRPTKETLHRFVQIVGKIRLAASTRRNHWWNVAFHVTGRGITSRPMYDAASKQIFTVDFDFVAHRLEITTLGGAAVGFPLAERSVAQFYRDILSALTGLGIQARPALPRPYGLVDEGRRFADDTEHASYDPAAVTRYWRVLSLVIQELDTFGANYAGKVSPAHHFWHSFDVAMTFFSDRHVDSDTSTDPVTREAYSRELISFGFWFGDDETPVPSFYAYMAPEPGGLARKPLAPAAARWSDRGGSRLAVLSWDEVRQADEPHEMVQTFYSSAFRAGATRAGWPTEWECRHGVTDPLRS